MNETRITIANRYPYVNTIENLESVERVDRLHYPSGMMSKHLLLENAHAKDIPASVHNKVTVFICTHTKRDKR